jgi:uncharacterized Zn finger protein
MGQSEEHSTEHTNRIESRREHGEKYRRTGGNEKIRVLEGYVRTEQEEEREYKV